MTRPKRDAPSETIYNAFTFMVHTVSRELNWDEFKIQFSITSGNPGITFSRLNELKTVEV